jgi:hypothetical protein
MFIDGVRTVVVMTYFDMSFAKRNPGLYARIFYESDTFTMTVK